MKVYTSVQNSIHCLRKQQSKKDHLILKKKELNGQTSEWRAFLLELRRKRDKISKRQPIRKVEFCYHVIGISLLELFVIWAVRGFLFRAGNNSTRSRMFRLKQFIAVSILSKHANRSSSRTLASCHVWNTTRASHYTIAHF